MPRARDSGPGAHQLPVASAAELPLAPLGPHLQDSTHTSFGVVTTGFVIDRIKLEASAFNGHEPNEERWSIQLGALAFSRLELVDKDELFPQAPVHPAYRIGAYTFGGTRDLIHDRAWQLVLLR
jgi:hypothetical protein